MNNPVYRRLVPAIVVILIIAASLLPLSSARADDPSLQPATTQCAAVQSQPKLDGPKDAYGRPKSCQNGTLVIYRESDPLPSTNAAKIAGGGPVDNNRVKVDNFFDPIKIDGRPTWDWTGPVAVFPNKDIAYVASKDYPWGETRLIVDRLTFNGNTLAGTTQLANLLVDGAHMTDVAIGDLNGDGFDDLVVTASDDRPGHDLGYRGNVNIFWGKSANHDAFDQVMVDAGDTPDAVAMVPVSSKRMGALVMNWNGGNMSAFTSSGITGTQTLSQTTYPANSDLNGWDTAIAGDIRGDGKPCVLAIVGQYYINPYFRSFCPDGKGGLTERQALYPPSKEVYHNPQGGIVMDVDHDGKNDVVILMDGNYGPIGDRYASKLAIYRQVPQFGSGNTITTTAQLMAADDLPQSPNAGDVNCDGVPDLDIESTGWYRSMDFYGLKGGGFDPLMRLEDHGVYVNGGRTSISKLVDLNGDGRVDRVFSADFNGIQVELQRPCVGRPGTKTQLWLPYVVNQQDCHAEAFKVTDAFKQPVTKPGQTIDLGKFCFVAKAHVSWKFFADAAGTRPYQVDDALEGMMDDNNAFVQSFASKDCGRLTTPDGGFISLAPGQEGPHSLALSIKDRCLEVVGADTPLWLVPVITS